MPAIPPDSDAIADTQAWLERAVIGLNLCPFAKAVHVRGQVHYAVCAATEPGALLQALEYEAKSLLALEPSGRDTTLLIATGGLRDFLDFNAFLGRAERLLARRGFDGVLQLASFHPHYQFAGTEADDATNCSNRTPWPTLHLLREASIDRAVEAFPDPEAIFGRNMAVLEQMGLAGWQALDVGPGAGARRPAGECA